MGFGDSKFAERRFSIKWYLDERGMQTIIILESDSE